MQVDTKSLKIAMVEADIRNLTHLSNITNIDRNTLSRIFRGKQLPTYRNIVKIALAFNLSEDQTGHIFFKN